MDLDAMALRVRELEQLAIDMHSQAQGFNKEGKFAGQCKPHNLIGKRGAR